MSGVPLVAYGIPLVVDAVACALLTDGQSGAGMLAHLLAAAVALSLTRRAASVARSESAAVAAALLVLALPVVGAATLALVLAPNWSKRARLATSKVVEVVLPGARGDVDEPETTGPATQRPIREVLRDAQSPHDRLRALMALRSMDARRAVPLLRLAFTHESEDVRLLAFAILSRREKRLRARIRITEARLQGKPGSVPSRRAFCHRRLALDHWELVYGGFVSGDTEEAVLVRAAGHANSALEAEPDARTAVLLARIHLRARRAEQAWVCLERAREAGAGQASLAPLFAEAAYVLRRFSEIPELLSQLSQEQLRRPGLGLVARFWTEGRDN